MAGVLSPVRSLGRAALDLLFPPRCVSCERQGAFLCERCVRELTPALGPRCPRCWQPGSDLDLCLDCQLAPPAFDGLRAAFVYQGPARRLIHALKYRGLTAAAIPAAALLAPAVRRWQLEVDLIVPVPLARLRQRLRGYNQAEALARALGRQLDLPVQTRALVRTRSAGSQTRAPDAEMRRRNVTGAFACLGDAVAGRRVLLVDDVATTGATLSESARALKDAGAAVVWALAFSRDD